MSYTREEFQSEFSVSRETIGRLDRYAELLGDWQSRMNLVGPSTLPNVWDRHFRDSAQLATLASTFGPQRKWLDIGAGGGFPGLVLAILDAGEVALVESIAKKGRFLQAVIDDLGLQTRATVHVARIEAMPSFPVDIITARACANLAQLFDWGLRFAASSTTWLLPKGASAEDEVVAAGQRFYFDVDLVPSRTDPAARIVAARGVKRK